MQVRCLVGRAVRYPRGATLAFRTFSLFAPLHLLNAFQSCYSCTYCSVRPSSLSLSPPATNASQVPTPPSDIIIDFGNNPSCESCFDAAAYKSHGVPPSPHLAQTGRAKVAPAPSKWGRESGGGAAGFGMGPAKGLGLEGKEEGVVGWRVRREREKSPMVASFDELGEKMRKAGLEDRPAVKALTTRAVSPIKREDTTAPIPQRWSTRNPLAGTTLPATSTSARPPTVSPPASPTRTTLPSLYSSRSPLPTPPLLPRVPGRSLHTSLKPIEDNFSNPPPTSSTPSKPSDEPKPSLANTVCPVCEKSLGYGEYIQLQTGEELHRDCFRCGGCGEVLGGGSFVVKEDKTYHKQVISLSCCARDVD